jgi:hypothetical protein
MTRYIYVLGALSLTLAATGGCAGRRGGPAQAAPVSTPRPNAAEELAKVFANAGCRECHNAQGIAADTRLVFPDLGAPTQLMEEAAADLLELVDAEDPNRSRLLRKPTKRLAHEGGQKIVPGSTEEAVLWAWISEVSRTGQDVAGAQRVLAAVSPSQAWPVRYDGLSSRFRRLSRDEIIASMELLIGSAPARDDLPWDQRPDHGVLLTSGTSFITNEMSTLKLAMGDFALQSAPNVLSRSGCSFEGQEQKNCLLAWSVRVAERAFRRAPVSHEKAIFQKILRLAGTSNDGDVSAVQGILSAIFLAPSFLYRTEIGTPVSGKPGLRALEGLEIATRLGFLATLAPPDAELIAAAKAGRLEQGAERVREFERLSKTELGRRALAVFVLEWLGANETKIWLKSAKYKKDLPDDFEAAVRASAEAAIRKVLTDSPNPTVADLFLTDTYLDDATIQAVVRPSGEGKNASGDTDETGRIGLMMHPQVLAAHTKENGSSPFQIGSFIREALLCQPVPPPPPDAADFARTDVPPGLTLRESLEYRTSVGHACTACHQTFAPLGFAFQTFDPIGRWMKQDPTGQPWDMSGTIATFSGVPISFKSPNELARALAHHPQVHGCFAQAALQWAFGRGLVQEDRELIAALDRVAKESRGSIPAIFQAIVGAPAFAHVTAPEK